MLFDLLFNCRSCDQPAPRRFFPLCEDCANSIRSAPLLCSRCGSHRCVTHPSFCFQDQESALIASYTARYLLIEPGYSVLKSWKKHGGPLFDRRILNWETEFFARLQSQLPRSGPIMITPVPQRFERTWRLGRSPAEVIARWIGLNLLLPIQRDLLGIKNSGRPNQRQAEMGLDQRLQSPSSFVASEAAIRLAEEPRATTILLVDDFMTSGSTLKSAALALKHAGFPRIHAAVLGYRPRQSEGEESSLSAEGDSETTGLISMPAARSAVST